VSSPLDKIATVHQCPERSGLAHKIVFMNIEYGKLKYDITSIKPYMVMVGEARQTSYGLFAFGTETRYQFGTSDERHKFLNEQQDLVLFDSLGNELKNYRTCNIAITT
jgi:hypothetical protein